MQPTAMGRKGANVAGIDRRTFLKGAAVMGGAVALGSRVLSSFADPSVIGSWSAQIRLGICGIHAAILNTGKVLYYERLGGEIGSKARLFDPATSATTDVSIPFHRNIMCSGMSFLPDGRFLATGGDPDDGLADSGIGNPHTTIFDPATNAWSDHDLMDFLRWYPSNVVLPDGRTLIIGGQAAPGGGDSKIKVMEVFDPDTLQVSRMPAGATKWMGLYPRTVLLANGQVMKAGKGIRTFRFDPAVPKWYFVDEMLGGDRKQGTVVLLPGNMKVMVCGGRSLTGTITDSAEVIDMSDPSPQWRLVGSLNRARQNHSVVILPDGKVLIVGGGSTNQPFGSPVGVTEMFDPATETFTPLASQTTNRTYHSTAVLLPDGRVISAGSNSGTVGQAAVDIYSPPYLFAGARPTITSVSNATLSWGASVEISTPDAASIAQVVLMKPGADTHQMNFDQRRLVCPFTTTASSVVATLPSATQANPPGYYMLIILNSQLVPSVATFVHAA
jgi:hypothetical protein